MILICYFICQNSDIILRIGINYAPNTLKIYKGGEDRRQREALQARIRFEGTNDITLKRNGFRHRHHQPTNT